MEILQRWNHQITWNIKPEHSEEVKDIQSTRKNSNANKTLNPLSIGNTGLD